MAAAVFSEDNTYRYYLGRATEAAGTKIVTFVMLNPSTADAFSDDATIRRCRRFAEQWGYAQMIAVNLLALCSTDPRRLAQVDDPVGPLNMHYVALAMDQADQVVCAWGARGGQLGQAQEVVELLGGVELWCLGLTKAGHPRHPLYLPSDTKPIPFTPAL